MIPLHVHPFFQKLNRIPITAVRDTVDHRDLELLAIDSYGTKRPEQAYGISDRRGFRHLYVAVSAVGPFIDIAENHDAASRDRKPYTFNLSTKKAKLYLNHDLSLSRLFHLIVNKGTGMPDKAEIISALVDVEPRYLAPPAWFMHELSMMPIEEQESGFGLFRAPNGVQLLTTGEASRLRHATHTATTSDALYVLNKLPHAITGAFLADKSVPAVYSYRGRDGRSSFSDMPIGPFASAGVTAGVRRYTHRGNSLQLERVLSGETPESHDTMRDIVHSVRQWESSRAA